MALGLTVALCIMILLIHHFPVDYRAVSADNFFLKLDLFLALLSPVVVEVEVKVGLRQENLQSQKAMKSQKMILATAMSMIMGVLV